MFSRILASSLQRENTKIIVGVAQLTVTPSKVFPCLQQLSKVMTVSLSAPTYCWTITGQNALKCGTVTVHSSDSKTALVYFYLIVFYYYQYYFAKFLLNKNNETGKKSLKSFTHLHFFTQSNTADLEVRSWTVRQVTQNHSILQLW